MHNSYNVGTGHRFEQLFDAGIHFTESITFLEAESALMKYQTIKRREENAARREAKIALAKQGLVGTESEIAAWRDNQEALARSQRSEQSQ